MTILCKVSIDPGSRIVPWPPLMPFPFARAAEFTLPFTAEGDISPLTVILTEVLVERHYSKKTAEALKRPRHHQHRTGWEYKALDRT